MKFTRFVLALSLCCGLSQAKELHEYKLLSFERSEITASPALCGAGPHSKKDVSCVAILLTGARVEAMLPTVSAATESFYNWHSMERAFNMPKRMNLSFMMFGGAAEPAADAGYAQALTDAARQTFEAFRLETTLPPGLFVDIMARYETNRLKLSLIKKLSAGFADAAPGPVTVSGLQISERPLAFGDGSYRNAQIKLSIESKSASACDSGDRCARAETSNGSMTVGSVLK